MWSGYKTERCFCFLIFHYKYKRQKLACKLSYPHKTSSPSQALRNTEMIKQLKQDQRLSLQVSCHLGHLKGLQMKMVYKRLWSTKGLANYVPAILSQLLLLSSHICISALGFGSVVKRKKVFYYKGEKAGFLKVLNRVNGLRWLVMIFCTRFE